jgi:hypothetical protein
MNDKSEALLRQVYRQAEATSAPASAPAPAPERAEAVPSRVGLPQLTLATLACGALVFLVARSRGYFDRGHPPRRGEAPRDRAPLEGGDADESDPLFTRWAP